ncbi:hypothetical protein BJY04DRAFT_185503 [Aspergillus karnatakaensis]|uniref:F-box protein n=1 Tax=Aspergillus karnatakaensis TaxID=1810916 RepID=UPI003CCCACE5
MSQLNGYILPIELLQIIIQLLDIDSFHSASLTCELWRAIALSIHNMRLQLKDVPKEVLPRNLISDATTPCQINALFRKVCHKNLIGMRRTARIQSHHSKPQTRRVGDIPIRSHQQQLQFARLRGLTLELHGPGGISKATEIQLNPSIYPTFDAVPQIWSHNYNQRLFGARASARFQVAVSSCGELVAVALGTKINVYLLRPTKAQTVKTPLFAAAQISDDLLDSIQSLEFTSDDQLLRCDIHGAEGDYVKYLGSRESGRKIPVAGRDMYWMRDCTGGSEKVRQWRKGLTTVYLDSRIVEEGIRGGLGMAVSLRGLRVFNPPGRPAGDHPDEYASERYFFALLREGPCGDRYVVGSLTAEGAVRILQQIQSRPTAQGYLGGYSVTEKAISIEEKGEQVDRWDTANLPTAYCYDPLLAISDDGKMLAILEPSHGQVQGAGYVCAADLYPDTETSERVKASPLVLSTLEHELDSLHISKDPDAVSYTVRARSHEQEMQWELQSV